MSESESSSQYSQASDSSSAPEYRKIIFGESSPGDDVAVSRGTTLLDTNVVRNTRDLWLNGFRRQDPSTECRLGNLILGPSVGEVVPLYGAAERAWKRRTRELNAGEFFEHLMACGELFGNRSLAVEVFTEGKVPGREPRAEALLVQMVAGGGQLFQGVVEDFVLTQVEPRYCVLLKIHELLAGPCTQASPMLLIDYCTEALDFVPGLELVLGICLLAPSTMLTKAGKEVRKVAGVVVKPGNATPHRAAWGGAWDLTFVRVRQSLNALTTATGLQCPPPFRIITAETAVAAIHDAFSFVPPLAEIFGSEAAVLDAGPEVFSMKDELLRAGSKLSRRFSDLPFERILSIASRSDTHADRERSRLDAELARFSIVFPEQDLNS